MTKQAARGAAFASKLKGLGPADVLTIGFMREDILSFWKNRVTRRVVLTGERRRHYLESHPEVSDCESTLQEAVLDPDEVQCNKKDPQIAILYTKLSAEAYLRVALWVSDTSGLQNSVHSFRRAHVREVRRGRKEGRVVWEKQ